MKNDIIAVDKNGKAVKLWDRVMYNGKVEMINSIRQENDVVQLSLEAWFGPYWVYETDIELVLS